MLSIIIPVIDQQEMTQECLDSIYATTGNYEVILVDNGSKDPYPDAIRNETNLGFPVAINQGIRAATGDIICLLNNDTIVTPGWSEYLEAALDDCAIVGPMTNYCAGEQRATLPSYFDRGGLYMRSSEWRKQYPGVFYVNFIIGFCMMFKRDLVNRIGWFDESLWPCSGEEIDFCMRAREAGLNVGIIQGVYIHHHGSQTFKDLEKDGQIKYAEIVNRNDAHLAKRWGMDFWLRQRIEEV